MKLTKEEDSSDDEIRVVQAMVHANGQPKKKIQGEENKKENMQVLC